ncbi:MAG: hypothetical protein E7531_01655 [Ruminococcaceae bacterium]|nr:hypothetical protein [Oscillospiraceae bacterium]
MICKKCGTEFEGNFCSKCGEKATTKCKKCGAEYIGDFCTNCGTKNIQPKKLLGFRSNKAWKKVLSIIYLVFTGLAILGSVTSIASMSDFVTTLSMIISMLVPYIFLSNFKFRKKIPLFNKYNAGMSALGLFCVYIAIAIIFSILNPANFCEHKWVEKENVKPTCTEQGHIKSHCDLCDTDNTEYIDKLEHTFEIVEDTAEKTVKKCSVCGETTTDKKQVEKENSTTDKNSNENTTTESKVEKHKHKYSKSTCDKPETCSCGEVKGEPLGHTTDCGICSRCDKEFRKQSPVTILDWCHNIDYVGGVEWNFRIRNNTDKQIKYVTLKWSCYNAVGDQVYDSIGWDPYVSVKFTGPLNAHATTDTKRNMTKFYNNTVSTYKMNKIVVEYMDGTTEEVTQYHDNIIG